MRVSTIKENFIAPLIDGKQQKLLKSGLRRNKNVAYF